MKVTISVLGRALLLKTPFPSLSTRRRRNSKSKSHASSKQQPEGREGEQPHGEEEEASTERPSSSSSFETADDSLAKSLHATGEEGTSEKQAFDDASDDDDDDDDSSCSSGSSSSSLSSCSVGNDQAAIQRRREEFHLQERLQLQADGEASVDKDVQVFLDISKQLSNQSLIFILQNHARQNMLNLVIPEEALNAVLATEVADDRTASSRGSHSSCAIKKTKKFRFAELANEKVRTIVHIIPRNDEIKEDEEHEEGDDNVPIHDVDPIERYWWTPQEYNMCRAEAIKL
jgi:hypothetical protein